MSYRVSLLRQPESMSCTASHFFMICRQMNCPALKKGRIPVCESPALLFQNL